MPSRSPPPLPTAAPPLHLYHHRHHHSHLLLIILLLVITLSLVILLAIMLTLLYRKLTRNPTHTIPTHGTTNAAAASHRFSYSLLRRSTANFHPSTLLGHGGFGSVHKASISDDTVLAVKLISSGNSIQAQHEFHNELNISSTLNSPYVVSLLGFSCNPKKTKLLLVFELMVNRSLQEALFDRKCVELMDWSTRFGVAVDVAKGLLYLHHVCDPVVVHGDVKPSNVLLDAVFRAKICDFGLARVKSEDLEECVEEDGGGRDDNGSVVEESESVVTGGCGEGLSPESCVIKIGDGEMGSSPVLDKGSVSEGGFIEKASSVDSGKELIGGERKKGCSRRDWWWKQENVGSESGRVKDYVMEWIGSEIRKERPKGEWIASSRLEVAKIGQKKRRKRLEWWASLDEEKLRKKEKSRKPREWWKEEFCDELAKKNKKKREFSTSCSGELWWQRDEGLFREKKKRKSKNSRGSIDWWLDGLSGEFRSGRRNSQDWASGDIPKSGGVSSTPSMRGTVCYIAPEYGGGGQLSEKSDVYSFGVLLLVLVSGRRPLQVTASPMSEFERANLISWARQLARNGRLLDLVDPCIHSLDKEQALLCITIALLCLQRLPNKRPSMKEIVGMLSGEAEPPHLPFEFSPSPPSNFNFKSRKKAR